jgi:dephospho-CoA kinase
MLDCDIGLIGLAGSGKDTAAKALIAKGWRRKAFADHLKILARNFGWNGVKDDRGRKLLQDIGMAARQYNSNFWIQQAYYGLTTVSNEYLDMRFVWTDVRFENEAEFIRKRGGVIIRIIRPNLQAGEHESESGQNKIDADYTVVNDGTVEKLHNTILNLLEAYD